MGNAFSWMAWTIEIAVFFSCVVLMLIGMTLWQLRSPSVERKGFLPIPTTRGDRLFIGLLSAAYVNLGVGRVDGHHPVGGGRYWFSGVAGNDALGLVLFVEAY